MRWMGHLGSFALGILLIFIGIGQFLNWFTIDFIPHSDLANAFWVIIGFIFAAMGRA